MKRSISALICILLSLSSLAHIVLFSSLASAVHQQHPSGVFLSDNTGEQSSSNDTREYRVLRFQSMAEAAANITLYRLWAVEENATTIFALFFSDDHVLVTIDKGYGFPYGAHWSDVAPTAFYSSSEKTVCEGALCFPVRIAAPRIYRVIDGNMLAELDIQVGTITSWDPFISHPAFIESYPAGITFFDDSGVLMVIQAEEGAYVYKRAPGGTSFHTIRYAPLPRTYWLNLTGPFYEMTVDCEKKQVSFTYVGVKTFVYDLSEQSLRSALISPSGRYLAGVYDGFTISNLAPLDADLSRITIQGKNLPYSFNVEEVNYTVCDHVEVQALAWRLRIPKVLAIFSYDSGAERYVIERIYPLSEEFSLLLLGEGFVIAVSEIKKLGGVIDTAMHLINFNGSSTSLVFNSTEMSAVLVDDMNNPKYAIVGTTGGDACLLRINATAPTLSFINCTKLGSPVIGPRNRKVVPSRNARLLPLVTENGTVFLFDPLANASYVFPLEEPGRAVAVSPTGTYIFLGNTMYAFIPGDPQSGNPRVRLWGWLVTPFSGADLSTPIVISPPTDQWHAYFWDGNITITKVETGWRAANLVTDERYLKGELGRLVQSGGVQALTVLGSFQRLGGYDIAPIPASKKDIEQVLKGEFGVTEVKGLPDDMEPTNTVMIPVIHIHPLTRAMVGSAGAVLVPLNVPLSVYSNVTLTANMRVAGFYYVIPPAGLGEAFAGGVISIGIGLALSSKVGEVASTAVAVGSGVGLAVGAALIGGVLLARWAQESVVYRLVLMAIPVLEDEYGNEYAAIQLFLPASVIGTETEKAFVNFAKETAMRIIGGGEGRVGITVTEFGRDWDDYLLRMREGRLPPVALDSLVGLSLSPKTGLLPSAFRIKRVALVTGQVTEGALKLWVKTLLVMQGLRFMVSGSVTGGRVETDPQKIAEMVRVVKVNGIPVNVIVKEGKAVAPFAIPGGAERLFISFEAPLYADITIYANMCLKRDFDTIAQLGFATNFHFNWKDQRIILYKLEFVDMTMPLVAAERVFRTAAYTFSHNIEEYFEVKQEWNDTSSPTGKRYYYATRNNVRLFDPLNGGILQYCKNFSVNYYYQEPPDVAIDIIFNGTDRATSLAQHAVVRLTSNTPQSVRFRARALVFTYEGTREVVFRTVELCSGCYAPECETRIGPEGVAFVPFDIRDLVAEAIARSKELEKVVGVKVVAWITQAEQNRLTHNDNATAVYYPPLGLVREYGAPALLFVYVHNALNGTPVVGATVIVSNGTTSQTAETNGTGWASFSLYTGLWNVTVSKTGYHSYTTQHLIVTNVSTLNVPLVPVSFSIPTNPETGQPVFPPQNHTDVPPITYYNPSTNETEYYWWVSVQVVWRDGFPFQGAHVTMVDAEKGTTIFEGTTNGTGFVHVLVENGTRLSIEVTATHPENSSLQYTETRNITVTRHWWLTFRVPWESQYFEPEVGLVSLQLLVHEGLGAFYGSVHHLVLVTLWTNTPQRVLLYVSIVDAENRTLSYQEVEVNLTQTGVYEKPVWLPVNLERGGYVRAYARVVEYERDTNPDNNEMWSSQVFLRPFLDVRIRIFWEMVEQRYAYAILPNDTLKIAVGVWANINVTTKLARLNLTILYPDVKTYRNKTLEKMENREVRIENDGTTLWFNFTITVPWSNRIYVVASVEHEWDISGLNNNASLVIPIWPEAILKHCRVAGGLAGRVYEEQPLSIACSIVSNVPEKERLPLAVTLSDNTTRTVLAAKNVKLAPELEVGLDFRAPRNPRAYGVIPAFSTVHELYVAIAGHDTIPDNNFYYIFLTVYSWLAILLAALLLLVVLFVLALLRAILHSVEDAARNRFVKKKIKGREMRFVQAVREERRFVRRRARRDEME